MNSKRIVSLSVPFLLAGFLVAGLGFKAPSWGLIGTDTAHAQPQEEEPEDTGPRSPSFGKHKMLEDQRRAIQPRRRPDTNVKTRDHRDSAGKATRHGGRVIQQDQKPGTAYATNSIDCGDRVYEVSTGSGEGSCKKETVDGKDVAVGCSDGKGNNAFATCSSGCGTSTDGSGSCKIKPAKQ